MKMLKKIIIVLSALIAVSFTAAAESVPYENYTYSEKNGNLVYGPQAYLPECVITGSELGLANMSSLSDIDSDEHGNLYLLDFAENRVIVLNSDLTLKNVFICYNGGTNAVLSEAKGIFTDDKYIYVADTGNAQILIMDRETGEQVKIVPAPSSAVLGKDFIFKPIRLATDSERQLYVVGEGTNEGIINMNWEGEFISFVGSSNVTASAWDIFWQKFSTKQQRKTSVQFIPQDHSSIDSDQFGFFYCTTYTAKDKKMVKRLNPGGADVIRALSSVGITGDQKAYYGGTLEGNSSFSDVSSGNYKIYACLDKTRSRIFCYNNDGYLLYSFGCSSNREGGFSRPSGITFLPDDRIAVSDEERGNVTVFYPTEYAAAIHSGLNAQNSLDYNAAYKYWKSVLNMNSEFELAHSEVGKVYLANGEYKKAMEEFKNSGNLAQYSRALAGYRSELIYDNIYLIAAAVILLIALIVFAVKMRRRKISNGVNNK